MTDRQPRFQNYKLPRPTATGVLGLPGDVFIPEDPDNQDWLDYQWWLAQGNTPQPAETLAEAKARKYREIDVDRDREIETIPVNALGRRWDAGLRSQQLLTSAIAVAQSGGPLPTAWRDYDNQNMPVSSINDLVAIANAIKAHVEAAYQRAWLRKEMVDAATTIDQVDAA